MQMALRPLSHNNHNHHKMALHSLSALASPANVYTLKRPLLLWVRTLFRRLLAGPLTPRFSSHLSIQTSHLQILTFNHLQLLILHHSPPLLLTV